MNRPLQLFILFLAITVIAGCRRHTDPRLERVAQLAAECPEEALDSLAAINPADLGEADRHYHAFLKIKASDKAYVVHKSDTTILKLVDYYSHCRKELYPEVLYYAGRVYSDLGDFPSALKYFQDALDNLPAESDRDPYARHIKGNVHSQYGRVLNSLRMYDEAILHLKEVLRIDSISNDSLNYLYDTQLLGAIYMHNQNYEPAEGEFKKALHLSELISPIDRGHLVMYLAGIKHYKGETDSARILIRKAINDASEEYKSVIYAYASDIYLTAGMMDSPYFFASEIVRNPLGYNHNSAYYVLLSPNISHLVPIDSVRSYAATYRSILEKDMNENNSRAAIMQNAYYNYKRHAQEKATAEKKNAELRQWIIIVLILLLSLLIIVLWLKIRNKRQLLELHEALENVRLLRQMVGIQPSMQVGQPSTYRRFEDDGINQRLSYWRNLPAMRNRLRQELQTLQQSAPQPLAPDSIILKSEAYRKLQTLINRNGYLADNAPLWDELESAVLQSSPNLKKHLRLLTLNNLTTIDWHMALLIKCFVSPTQMVSLIGRTKGTVSSRRSTLCFKIFDEKLGTRIVDDIIRLL